MIVSTNGVSPRMQLELHHSLDRYLSLEAVTNAR